MTSAVTTRRWLWGGTASLAGPRTTAVAVVEEEMGLGVLPTFADRGAASFPGGGGGHGPVKVALEGVVGHVHHGEVDPVLL
jgi:hypothetical protein